MNRAVYPISAGLSAPEISTKMRARVSKSRPVYPSSYVLDQLKEALRQVGVKQSELVRRLAARDPSSKWTDGRLSKLFNERRDEIVFRVDDLVMMCEEAEVSLVEVVRQRGRELVGDLTPSEKKVLDLLRENPTLASNIIALLPERKASYKAMQAATRARIAKRMSRMEPRDSPPGSSSAAKTAPGRAKPAKP